MSKPKNPEQEEKKSPSPESEENKQPNPEENATPESGEKSSPESEEKPEPPAIPLFWTVNAKYRGKRYRAGAKADVSPEDVETLLANKVIRRAEV